MHVRLFLKNVLQLQCDTYILGLLVKPMKLNKFVGFCPFLFSAYHEGIQGSKGTARHITTDTIYDLKRFSTS